MGVTRRLSGRCGAVRRGVANTRLSSSGCEARPNVGSQWQRDGRLYSDEADPRAWIDRVLDDEFPLSMFYETLNKKLAEELVAA